MSDLLNDVRAVLSTTPGRWQNLADSLPAELLGRPAAPGEWSAVQCLGHLVDTEATVFPPRVHAFLEGRDMPAFDPDSEGTDPGERSLADLVAEFAARRKESIVLLSGLAESDLQRGSVHAELGPVTLGEMLNEWAAHDLMHTVQAERALMQAFIPSSGPWRTYFTDHDLAPAG